MGVRLSVVAVLIVGVAIAAHAQAPPSTPTPDFWAARTEREQARVTANQAVFERMTTDAFFVVDPTGFIGDKKERLGRMARRGGAGRGGAVVPRPKLNERATVYNGDTVVLYWQEKGPEGLEHVTETWVREGGQWKVAAAHVSRPE